MRTLKLLVIFALYSKFLFGASFDIPIGKERIISTQFPKFSLSSSYNGFRYGGITNESMGRLNTTYGLSLGFDVGLYKYLHAGATLALMSNFSSKVEPIYYRFNMFLRPLVSFFDQLSIFARIGAGLGLIISSPVEAIIEALPSQNSAKIAQKYDSKYYGDISPGAHGLATVGIEYFPFTRLGISLEWGILAEYLYVSKSEQLKNSLEKKMGVVLADNAPKSFGYFAYELPISLNLNIIF